MLPTIQKIEKQGLTWLNVNKIGAEEIKYLEENYHFHPVNLADCLSPMQRPKLDVRPGYLFMVLVFPVYKRKTRTIISAEVDFFIRPDLLVTVHNNELSPLINFFNLCQISESQQKNYLSNGPSVLLYEILNRLFIYCNPILESLQLSIASVEEHIFQGYERKMVREILIVKRSINNFCRIMQVHESVINKLINKGKSILPLGQLEPHYAELVETSGDISFALDNMHKNMDALEQTNNSLINFRLNDIIKILTTISVTILPISLIASIFGMSLRSIPLSNHPNGFWIVLIIMILFFVGLISYFKKRQWL